MDVLTKQQRKRCMSAVRNKNTKPEMIVRRLVHSLGYRYSLHARSLPGKPDLVLTSKRKVIFINGCFWHRHSCKKGKSIPSIREDFWREKLTNNKIRDKKNQHLLKNLGWRSLIIWECQTQSAKIDRLRRRIVDFLES